MYHIYKQESLDFFKAYYQDFDVCKIAEGNMYAKYINADNLNK